MAAKSSKSKTLPAATDIDFKKLFKLRYHNRLSYGQISEQTGIARSTLHYWFSPVEKLIKSPEALHVYADNRADVLGALEYELLTDLLDEDKRKKASLNNVAYAFQQIHVARRLEQGLSTGNLAVNVEKSLTTAHEKAQKMRDKLRKSAVSE